MKATKYEPESLDGFQLLSHYLALVVIRSKLLKNSRKKSLLVYQVLSHTLKFKGPIVQVLI